MYVISCYRNDWLVCEFEAESLENALNVANALRLTDVDDIIVDGKDANDAHYYLRSVK